MRNKGRGLQREMEVLAPLQAIREGSLSLHPSFPPPLTSAVIAKVTGKGTEQRRKFKKITYKTRQ